jgi:hypothetical protein
VGKYRRAGQATDDNKAHALAYWITKTTNAHSDYLIVIAFPLQQWLHESATMLRYTSISCSVFVATVREFLTKNNYKQKQLFVILTGFFIVS